MDLGPLVVREVNETQNVCERVCHSPVMLDKVVYQLLRVEGHGSRQVDHPGGRGHPQDQKGDLRVVKLLDLLQELAAGPGDLVQLTVDEGVGAEGHTEVEYALVRHGEVCGKASVLKGPRARAVGAALGEVDPKAIGAQLLNDDLEDRRQLASSHSQEDII
ncbi:MAG: hypothetical protein ACPG1A_11015 [Halioglobus sp.]